MSVICTGTDSCPHHSNPTPELASAINAAQQGTALALAGSVQLALAEGLTGIIGVGSTFSSALPSVTTSATSTSEGEYLLIRGHIAELTR